MELEAMDTKDLKAAAYDCLALIQQTQAQLQLINQQIEKKSKEVANADPAKE